jgi:endonuclease-3
MTPPKPPRSKLTRAEIAELYGKLADRTPAPETELEAVNDFTLLVAVVLSARRPTSASICATRELFRTVNTPQAMLDYGEQRLRETIKTIGLFNTKARNVILLSRVLVDQFDGRVPADRDLLIALPGVGRKTANVVMNVAFGAETFAVDTHVFRVSNRTGLAPWQEPARGRARPRSLDARALQARCPSPADPARPLRVQGARSRMLALRDRPDLPLSAQDAAARHRSQAVACAKPLAAMPPLC